MHQSTGELRQMLCHAIATRKELIDKSFELERIVANPLTSKLERLNCSVHIKELERKTKKYNIAVYELEAEITRRESL